MFEIGPKDANRAKQIRQLIFKLVIMLFNDWCTKPQRSCLKYQTNEKIVDHSTKVAREVYSSDLVRSAVAADSTILCISEQICVYGAAGNCGHTVGIDRFPEAIEPEYIGSLICQ